MRQLWTQAAVIALTAGTLAACETTGAQYPTRADAGVSPPVVQAPPAATAPLPAPPPEDDAPPVTAPVGAGAVSSQPLAPVTTAEIQPPPSPPADSRPLPAPPVQQQPAMRPVVVTTTGGKVVDVSGGPQIYTVQSGEGLDAVGRKMGLSRAELAKLNDLEEPYRLKPGQKLKGQSTKAKAYVVESGDTLSAIARRFSVTPAALAAENDLSTGASIRSGQRIRLPDGYKDKGPAKTTVMQPVAGGSTLAGAAPPPSAWTPPASARPTTTQPSRPVVAERDPEPAPAATSTTTVSIAGKVVEVAGKPKVHTVKSGDAIDSIARDLGTTRKDLVEDNDLKAPYVIRPGQKLKGPATTDKAYVAESGDTLAGVAKRFNVSVSALSKENNLRAGATLKKGQKIVLPDGYRDRGPIRTTVTTPAPRPSTPAPIPGPTTTAQAPIGSSPAPTTGLPSSPRPYTPSASTPSYPRPSAPVSAQPVTPPPAASRPIIESSAPPTEAEITAAGRGRFVWPLRGEMISDFGPKGTGQRNDGVNIRASAGASVKAAASGEVVYAGNQVPGFGNLVLVKHADGWVTAYAHLGTTDVRMRQQVGQGEQLGTVGSTGGVNEPQLHFEVRYAPTPKDKAKPIDPGLVLPR